MSGSLFLIEAPGKVRAFTEHLHSLGRRGTVRATRGHIADFPNDIREPVLAGGQARGYRLTESGEKTVQGLLDEARETVAMGGKVYVATDPDEEGERIAADLRHYLARAGVPDAAMRRMRVPHMTDSGIARAMDEAGPIHDEDAAPSRARRLVDRLVASHASSFSEGFVAGRVQTGFLGALFQGAGSAKHPWRARGTTPDGYEWSEVFESRETAEAVGQALSHAPVNPSGEWETTANAHRSLPDGWAALDRALAETTFDAGRIGEALERLYLGGRLSYPRTTEKTLGPFADTARDVVRSHLPAGTPLRWPEGAWGQGGGAHQAVIPLDADFPVAPKRAGEPLGDADVGGVLLRALLEAGDGASVTETLGRPGEGAPPIAAFVNRFVKRAGPRRAWERRHPKPGRYEVEPERDERVRLSILKAARLGRPSTAPRHIGRTRAYYDQGQVTEKARADLALAQVRCAPLLEMATHARIEEAIHAEGVPVMERVHAALEAASLPLSDGNPEEPGVLAAPGATSLAS